jgi:hypothetical protein
MKEHCEICGVEGIYTGIEYDRNATIITMEYRNPRTGHIDTQRVSKDVKGCIDRIDRNAIRLNILSQSQIAFRM